MKDSQLSKKTKKQTKQDTSPINFRQKSGPPKKPAWNYLVFNLIFLIPLLLSLILFALLRIHTKVQEENARLVLYKSPISFPQVSYYPFVSGVDFSRHSVSAPGIAILDSNTKTVLFSQNAAEIFSTASTAKIMTAVIALEYYKPDDILTIQSSYADGAVVGFKEGERVFFQDALYGMLLPSGNDAALAIAQNFPGGEKAFVEKMNKKAVSLYLAHTKFTDSSGLDDDGDVTTPLELAYLASYAMQNKYFAKVVSTKQKTITTLNGNTYLLQNLNQLLDVEGVNGVKTGSTPKAGEILATSKNENGHPIIFVVMKSSDRFTDTLTLLSLLSGRVTYLPIHP